MVSKSVLKKNTKCRRITVEGILCVGTIFGYEGTGEDCIKPISD